MKMPIVCIIEDGTVEVMLVLLRFGELRLTGGTKVNRQAKLIENKSNPSKELIEFRKYRAGIVDIFIRNKKMITSLLVLKSKKIGISHNKK